MLLLRMPTCLCMIAAFACFPCVYTMAPLRVPAISCVFLSSEAAYLLVKRSASPACSTQHQHAGCCPSWASRGAFGYLHNAHCTSSMSTERRTPPRHAGVNLGAPEHRPAHWLYPMTVSSPTSFDRSPALARQGPKMMLYLTLNCMSKWSAHSLR
jgi:hypothetical protein